MPKKPKAKNPSPSKRAKAAGVRWFRGEAGNKKDGEADEKAFLEDLAKAGPKIREAKAKLKKAKKKVCAKRDPNTSGAKAFTEALDEVGGDPLRKKPAGDALKSHVAKVISSYDRHALGD